MYYKEHISSKIVSELSSEFGLPEDKIRDVIEHQYSFLKDKIMKLDLKHVKLGGVFVFKPRYKKFMHLRDGYYIRYPYNPHKQEEHVKTKPAKKLSDRLTAFSIRLNTEHNMRVFKYNKGLIQHGDF